MACNASCISILKVLKLQISVYFQFLHSKHISNLYIHINDYITLVHNIYNRLLTNIVVLRASIEYIKDVFSQIN